ncbi:hypothetical protein ILUMI_05030 [Ignelater luminosus]|uniref:Acyl-CoA dehydrogenase/oxidase N-terminal domain-containing protein n=1 Tax=Ignelater luminosus TaxID=2038154 RepID=A0A8K0GIH5_IGNLU|nr:hypothetical protein ILUMI_05030 [Ignelater luminosus]
MFLSKVLRNTRCFLQTSRTLSTSSPKAAAQQNETGTSPNGFCFALSETQKEIQDLARKFSREEILPVAAEYDKTGEFPWPLVKKAWSLGLVTNVIPTEYGGLGHNVFDDCLIVEETSYACSGINIAIYSSKLGVSN